MIAAADRWSLAALRVAANLEKSVIDAAERAGISTMRRNSLKPLNVAYA
jgi:hypothetical protein